MKLLASQDKMASREAIKEMQEVAHQLIQEDKKFSSQLTAMEDDFTAQHRLTRDDFNELYSEGVKNFQLDFGTVCERGRDQLVEGLRARRDKKRVAAEYLACVELTRQKAAQRVQQE